VTGPEHKDPKLPGDPVAELEAFIADTEARGEPVPAEARMMLDRLRELMTALQSLTASFEPRAEPGERTAQSERSDDDDDHH
jgi:hypothetical protein